MSVESINIPKNDDLPDNNLKGIAETIRPYFLKTEIKDDEYAKVAFALLNLEGDKGAKNLVANFIQRQQQDLKVISDQKWDILKNINDRLIWAARAYKEKK